MSSITIPKEPKPRVAGWLSPQLAHPEHVFEFYDEPVLFTCRNALGARWLVVLVDAEGPRRQWLCVPLSEDRHAAIASGAIELRTAFEEAEGDQALLITDEDGSYDEELVLVSDLTDAQLPSRGQRLEIPLEAPTFPILERATGYRQDTVAVRVKLGRTDFGRERTEIRAGVLGGIVSNMQNTLSAIAQVKSGGTDRGRIPARVAREAELCVAGFFHGSFGVELRASAEPDLFGASAIAPVLDDFMRLLEATQQQDAESLRELAASLKHRPIRRFLLLLEGLLDTEGMEFRWARPRDVVERRADLTADNIAFGVDLLAKVEDVGTEVFWTRVQLVAAHTRTKTFEVYGVADRQKYSGRVADEAMQSLSHATLMDYYDAHIEESSGTTATGDYQPKYRLLALEKVGAPSGPR